MGRQRRYAVAGAAGRARRREEAFGILRPPDNAPLRTDSIFRVMSISKPFTAAAVICLVEDGLLWLKHPITDCLPEITAPGADQVLIADLLANTSGYDDLVVFPLIKARIDEGREHSHLLVESC